MATAKPIVRLIILSTIIIGIFYLSFINEQSTSDYFGFTSISRDNNASTTSSIQINQRISAVSSSSSNYSTPTVDTFLHKKRRKIFMMETSGNSKVNARQACAVESAARQNPNMDVILYFISPTLNISDSHIIALAETQNIRFRFINLNAFFNDTPLQKWYSDGAWKKSPYKVAHMSDALRFLILWKFGGIYLDLDVVVMKSLEDLKNCAGKQSEFHLANGVMAFDQHHPFLSKCLDDFATNYKGDDWDYNGPLLITRILKKECGGINNIDQISREKCNGVTALPTSAFYAIPWQRWEDFFNSENATKIMSSWNDSYLIHVWNKHSVKVPVVIGSGQPYELAAKKNCPLIYATNEESGYF